MQKISNALHESIRTESKLSTLVAIAAACMIGVNFLSPLIH